MEQTLLSLVSNIPGVGLLFWLVLQVRDGKYIPEHSHQLIVDLQKAQLTEVIEQYKAQLEQQERSFKEYLDEVRRYGDKGWAAAEKSEAALAENNKVLARVAESMSVLTATVENRRR